MDLDRFALYNGWKGNIIDDGNITIDLMNMHMNPGEYYKVISEKRYDCLIKISEGVFIWVPKEVMSILGDKECLRRTYNLR